MSSFDVSQISVLSDMELVRLLTDNGLPSGPITGSTRKVFENLLRNRLTKLTGCHETNESKETEQVLMGKVKGSYVKFGGNDAAVPSNINPAKKGENGTFYYGVCCTGSDGSAENLRKESGPLVFSSQELALEVVKSRKGARFKAFRSKSEAELFSLSEAPVAELTVKESMKQKIGVEPVSNFKSPTPREIVVFRKAIENGDVEQVREKAYYNPKYLISSGETPVILQEGSRYNAMHVAVRSKKRDVCELINNILSDDKFWNSLFPETKETSRELMDIRKQRMIDLYLNTPDKVACETPLHMAAKNGALEIVEYLKSFSSLVTISKNVHGETPQDVVCARYTGSNKEKLTDEICSVLEGRSYIPVFRPDDGSSLPYIGKPVTQAMEAFTDQCDGRSAKSHSPLDMKYVVKAYAGPMSPKKAGVLYDQWMRSPKEREWSKVTREDFEKGLERIGRKLSKEQNVPWTEYWSFLGGFENLSSEAGLRRLEQHLQDRETAIRSHIIQIYSTPQRYQKSKTMRKPCSPAIARVREMDFSPGVRQQHIASSTGSLARSSDPGEDVKKRLFTDATDSSVTNEVTSASSKSQNGSEKLDIRARLVRQEAYCDTKEDGSTRHKLGNLRSLSAGDAEIKNKRDEDGISLKYSFDLEESFQNSSLDTSVENSNEAPKPKTDQRSPSRFPIRALSDVAELFKGLQIRHSPFRTDIPQMPSPLASSSPESTRKQERVDSQATSSSTPPCARTSHGLTSVLSPVTPVSEVDKIPLPLFVEGLQPTKTDLDVLRALEFAEIDSERFPAVYKWVQLVTSFSLDNQQSWPSPGSPRYRSRVFDKSPIWSC